MRPASAPATPALVVALLVASMLLAGCEEKVKPPISANGLSGDIPSQESWNASIRFTDSGRTSAVLRAGHIAMYAARGRTMLDSGIVVDFYDTEQRHTSVLTARRGIVNDATKDFEARDSVVVVSDSGTTLRTEELYWLNAARKVRSPAYVEIVSPTEQLRGQGFESDQSLKHYTVFQVSGKAKGDE